MSSALIRSTNGRRSRVGGGGDGGDGGDDYDYDYDYDDDDDDEHLSKRKKTEIEDTNESDSEIISMWDVVKQDYNNNDNNDDSAEKSSSRTSENNNSCVVVGWRKKLPDSESSTFPRKFLDVLIMMDLLLTKEEKGNIDSFSEELYHHKRHGNRKGIRTRKYLRKLEKKGDTRLQWHMPKKEWSPITRDDLVSFVEVLHEISTVFV
jgi:hypothetical protein